MRKSVALQKYLEETTFAKRIERYERMFDEGYTVEEIDLEESKPLSAFLALSK